MIDISGHLHGYRQESGFEDKENYLTVNCCGYQKFITKNFSRNREHGRLDYQIIYIVKGKGFYNLDGEMKEIDEGNIILYRPGEVQNYSYYFDHNPEVYWVHFTGYGVDQILKMVGLLDKNVNFIGLSNTTIDCCKEIINELQIKKPIFEVSVNAALSKMLAIMGRKVQEQMQSTNQKMDLAFQKVLTLMHSSYNLKWSIHDFARECNLSTYWFIHSFKTYFGMSPIQYLTKIKMDKARELLTDSSLNVSEISEVLGYDNSLYFSRVFKKTTGVCPRDYRTMIYKQ